MKGKWPLGLAALALAAILHGGDKPAPHPAPRLELVIIVEPLADGIYSTRDLHIEKERLNEIQSSLDD